MLGLLSVEYDSRPSARPAGPAPPRSACTPFVRQELCGVSVIPWAPQSLKANNRWRGTTTGTCSRRGALDSACCSKKAVEDEATVASALTTLSPSPPDLLAFLPSTSLSSPPHPTRFPLRARRWGGPFPPVLSPLLPTVFLPSLPPFPFSVFLDLFPSARPSSCGTRRTRELAVDAEGVLVFQGWVYLRAPVMSLSGGVRPSIPCAFFPPCPADGRVLLRAEWGCGLHSVCAVTMHALSAPAGSHPGLLAVHARIMCIVISANNQACPLARPSRASCTRFPWPWAVVVAAQ
ncbi:hypothetical protein FB451DRAFT_1406744 [Mycena latifolia]|nr:hypothetical protein FB451DRAFT_1406744 [Mycena latifolia]